MLKVGITGGIGSGKSVVCQVFNTLGIPAFNADNAAKYLMEHDPTLVSNIKTLFGEEVYIEDKLNRQLLSSIVFNNPKLLQQLNALVHPLTIAYGKEWMELQSAPYIIKEAAIFFESGTYKEMDVMIGVTAPEPLRIRRAMNRDNATREKIAQRIAQQMDEQEKMNRCDYIITNDDKTAIIPQVERIHQTLLARSKS
ncbi:MAG: dephospho-CoA kinase [Flavipsychrobacter sp.]